MDVLTRKEQQVQPFDRSPDRPSPAPPRQGDRTVRDGRPPLDSGDRLTRTEFEHRYAARPDIKKAELIEGVVYVPLPVSLQHGEPHSDIIAWVGTYRAATPGIRIADNTSLRLDVDNEPQPDVSVWIDDPTGQALRVPKEGFLEVVPELIIEVAASSAAYDLHDKLNVYRRNRVQEYLVLVIYERETRWHTWREGEYQLLEPDEEGILRSRVFPGLWLHPERFWEGDLAGVLAVLQRGLESHEHQAFVRRLRGEEQ